MARLAEELRATETRLTRGLHRWRADARCKRGPDGDKRRRAATCMGEGTIRAPDGRGHPVHRDFGCAVARARRIAFGRGGEENRVSTTNANERTRLGPATALALLGLGAGCYTGLGDVGSGHGAGGQLAAAEGGGTGGGGDGGGTDGTPPADFQPEPGAMRRLTIAQYHNAVADVFGDAIVPTVDLEEDETTEVFLSIGASKVGTSEHGVEQYQAAASDVATQVFAHRGDYELLVDCGPQSADDPCARAFLEHYGRLLWRRPLDADELDRYVALVGADYENGQNPPLGLQYALAAMLQSPNFLYVPQIGEEDPDTGLRRYTSLEMASRLSFFVWDSIPDDELLVAAEADALLDPADVAAQVDRMLDQPRAADLAGRFFAEAWNVQRMAVNDKNPEVFPDWNDTLLGEYRDEFRMFLADLVARDGDVRDIFSGKTTFASPELAGWYGLPAPDANGAVPLDDTRFGLLTSGAVVAANSPSDRTSPTIRGKFVLERLMCQTVPPPPPNVNNTLPDDDGIEGETLRKKLERHRKDPNCAVCHEMIDPLGFVFENYDGVGHYRTEDNGTAIDSSGSFGNQTFAGAGDLSAFLASDESATQCVAQLLLGFATGRETTKQDVDIAAQLQQAFAAAGYGFHELVVQLATQPTFRYLAEPQ